jgi:hypothetical protein
MEDQAHSLEGRTDLSPSSLDGAAHGGLPIPSNNNNNNQDGGVYRELPTPTPTTNPFPYVPREEAVYRSVEACYPMQTAALFTSGPLSQGEFGVFDAAAGEDAYLKDARRFTAMDIGKPLAFGSTTDAGAAAPFNAGRSGIPPRKPTRLLPTAFMSHESPVMLLDHLRTALASSQTDFSVKDHAFKVKGRYHCRRGGLVQFEARVYDATSVCDDGVAAEEEDGGPAPPLSAVEFRRLRGCAMAWNTLFRTICTALSDTCPDAPALSPEEPTILAATAPVCPDLTIVPDLASLCRSPHLQTRAEAIASIANIGVAARNASVEVPVEMFAVARDQMSRSEWCERAPVAHLLESMSQDDSFSREVLASVDADSVLQFLEWSLANERDVFGRRAAVTALCNMCVTSDDNRKRVLNGSRIPSLLPMLRSSSCAITRGCGMELSSALGIRG